MNADGSVTLSAQEIERLSNLCKNALANLASFEKGIDELKKDYDESMSEVRRQLFELRTSNDKLMLSVAQGRKETTKQLRRGWHADEEKTKKGKTKKRPKIKIENEL